MNFEVNIRTLIAKRSHDPNKVGVYRKGEKNFATNITGAEGRRLQTDGYSSYHIYITHSKHPIRVGDVVLNTIDWTISRVNNRNGNFLKLKEYQVPADKCELIVASTDGYQINLKQNSEHPSSHHEAEDKCPSCLEPIDLAFDMVTDDTCSVCDGDYRVLPISNKTIGELIKELNRTSGFNYVPVVPFQCASCSMDGEVPTDHKMGCNHKDPAYSIWSPKSNDGYISLDLYGGECGGELEWVDDYTGMDIYKCLNCGLTQDGDGSTCHADVSGDYKDVVESTNKQFSGLLNLVCKGSMSYGTGCGSCVKCKEQIAQAGAPKEKPKSNFRLRLKSAIANNNARNPSETINKNDIMEATEAKRIAETYNKSVDDTNLKAINELIATRAKSGHFDGYYHKEPSEELYGRLENLGYELDETDEERDGYTLQISWSRDV